LAKVKMPRKIDLNNRRDSSTRYSESWVRIAQVNSETLQLCYRIERRYSFGG
jgi:hypothetical protein